MGGYLLLRVTSGLTDALSLLWYNSKYAKEHDRTIIFCLYAYKATDLDSIIDFSQFPVKVLCGEEHIKNIVYSKIEPSCFDNDPYKEADSTVQDGPYNIPSIGNMITKFDPTKSYPADVLLIFQGFGNVGESEETIKHIHFSKKVIDNYHSKISQLPKTFDAVHLRATDHHDQNTEDDLAAVRKFVENKQNVYLATDNMKFMESLSEEFSQIIKSFTYEKIEHKYYSLHHDFGKTDPDCLEKALIDILICATSAEFLPSVGGFSELISYLHTNKELLQQLTSIVVDEIQEPKEELTSTVVNEPDKLQITSPSAHGKRKTIGEFFWLLQK
jgi:hypothetical protein